MEKLSTSPPRARFANTTGANLETVKTFNKNMPPSNISNPPKPLGPPPPPPPYSSRPSSPPPPPPSRPSSPPPPPPVSSTGMPPLLPTRPERPKSPPVAVATSEEPKSWKAKVASIGKLPTWGSSSSEEQSAPQQPPPPRPKAKPGAKEEEPVPIPAEVNPVSSPLPTPLVESPAPSPSVVSSTNLLPKQGIIAFPYMFANKPKKSKVPRWMGKAWRAITKKKSAKWDVNTAGQSNRFERRTTWSKFRDWATYKTLKPLRRLIDVPPSNAKFDKIEEYIEKIKKNSKHNHADYDRINAVNELYKQFYEADVNGQKNMDLHNLLRQLDEIHVNPSTSSNDEKINKVLYDIYYNYQLDLRTRIKQICEGIPASESCYKEKQAELKKPVDITDANKKDKLAELLDLLNSVDIFTNANKQTHVMHLINGFRKYFEETPDLNSNNKARLRKERITAKKNMSEPQIKEKEEQIKKIETDIAELEEKIKNASLLLSQLETSSTTNANTKKSTATQDIKNYNDTIDAKNDLIYRLRKEIEQLKSDTYYSLGHLEYTGDTTRGIVGLKSMFDELPEARLLHDIANLFIIFSRLKTITEFRDKGKNVNNLTPFTNTLKETDLEVRRHEFQPFMDRFIEFAKIPENIKSKIRRSSPPSTSNMPAPTPSPASPEVPARPASPASPEVPAPTPSPASPEVPARPASPVVPARPVPAPRPASPVVPARPTIPPRPASPVIPARPKLPTSIPPSAKPGLPAKPPQFKLSTQVPVSMSASAINNTTKKIINSISNNNSVRKYIAANLTGESKPLLSLSQADKNNIKSKLNDYRSNTDKPITVSQSKLKLRDIINKMPVSSKKINIGPRNNQRRSIRRG